MIPALHLPDGVPTEPDQTSVGPALRFVVAKATVQDPTEPGAYYLAATVIAAVMMSRVLSSTDGLGTASVGPSRLDRPESDRDDRAGALSARKAVMRGVAQYSTGRKPQRQQAEARGTAQRPSFTLAVQGPMVNSPQGVSQDDTQGCALGRPAHCLLRTLRETHTFPDDRARGWPEALPVLWR